jgi:hypothetical protein
VLLLTGILGLFLHFRHRRERAALCLRHTPGSIASSAALLTRTGPVARLAPHDTDSQIDEKLAGMRFTLSPHTGALLVEGEDASAGHGKEEELQLGLLGHKSSPSTSSLKDHLGELSHSGASDSRPYVGYTQHGV